MSSDKINLVLIQHEKTKLEISASKTMPRLHYLTLADASGGRQIAISKELFTLLKKELL